MKHKKTHNTYQKGKNNVSVENNENIIINNNGADTNKKSGLKIFIPLLIIVILLIAIFSVIIIKTNIENHQEKNVNQEQLPQEKDNGNFMEIKSELEKLNSELQKKEENNKNSHFEISEKIKEQASHENEIKKNQEGQQLNFNPKTISLNPPISAGKPISSGEPISVGVPIDENSLSSFSDVSSKSDKEDSFNNSIENETIQKEYSGPMGDICFINENFYSRKVKLTSNSNKKITELLIGKEDKGCLYDFPIGVYNCEVYTTFSKKCIEKFQLKIIEGKSMNHKFNSNHYN